MWFSVGVHSSYHSACRMQLVEGWSIKRSGFAACIRCERGWLADERVRACVISLSICVCVCERVCVWRSKRCIPKESNHTRDWRHHTLQTGSNRANISARAEGGKAIANLPLHERKLTATAGRSNLIMWWEGRGGWRGRDGTNRMLCSSKFFVFWCSRVCWCELLVYVVQLMRRSSVPIVQAPFKAVCS